MSLFSHKCRCSLNGLVCHVKMIVPRGRAPQSTGAGHPRCPMSVQLAKSSMASPSAHPVSATTPRAGAVTPNGCKSIARHRLAWQISCGNPHRQPKQAIVAGRGHVCHMPRQRRSGEGHRESGVTLPWKVHYFWQ